MTSTDAPLSGPAVRSRKRASTPPCPDSVLDPMALRRALDRHGLAVKETHIDAFYQSLHRQHYPDLPQFVQNYYQHEQNQQQRRQRQQEDPTAPSLQNSAAQAPDASALPLKNAVSNRKNRNRLQLPKSMLDFLASPSSGLVTLTSRVVQVQTSTDGSTSKLAIQLHDGQLVESVLMRYTTSDENSRVSLCISSQCGCAMKCTFCATGTMGLSGNLSTGEILEQIVHADRLLAQEWQQQVSRQSVPSNSTEIDNAENVDLSNIGSPDDATHETGSSTLVSSARRKGPSQLGLVRNVVFMGVSAIFLTAFDSVAR
jgi:hypothetical protein